MPPMPIEHSEIFDPLQMELELRPLPPEQIVEGEPRISFRILDISADGRIERGIWQHTAGVSLDVEVDEIFIILRGRATVEVEGCPSLEIGPGDVGLLRAGDRTTWRVHEDLRKIYQVTLDPK